MIKILLICHNLHPGKLWFLFWEKYNRLIKKTIIFFRWLERRNVCRAVTSDSGGGDPQVPKHIQQFREQEKIRLLEHPGRPFVYNLENPDRKVQVSPVQPTPQVYSTDTIMQNLVTDSRVTLFVRLIYLIILGKNVFFFREIRKQLNVLLFLTRLLYKMLCLNFQTEKELWTKLPT